MVQTSLAAWLKKSKAKDEEIIPPAPPVNNDSEQAAVHETVTEPTRDGQKEQGHQQNGQLGDRDGDAQSQDALVKGARIPSSATLESITEDILPSFRRMVAVLLPVPYPDKFYKDIITDEIAGSISAVALWHDKPGDKGRVVAGIRCRLISHPAATHPAPSLYVSTITTLAPFRGHGLARALLRRVTAIAIKEYDIGTVTAHMWEKHEEDAGAFYEKSGFKKLRFEENYYRKLRPGGATLFERIVTPSDLLGETESNDRG